MNEVNKVSGMQPATLPLAGTEQVELVQRLEVTPGVFQNKNVRLSVSELFSSGASAYEVAVAAGFEGTEIDWLASLVGPQGEQGIQGIDGKTAYDVAVEAGFVGDATAWLSSLVGATGKSAYDMAVDAGFVGDLAAWLGSLKGDKGDQGVQGEVGKSAYQHAVDGGFVGDEAAWLLSLIGPQGRDAYQVASDAGFEGTVQEWLASLKGDKGDTGVGIKLIGNLDLIEQLPAPADYSEGDTFIIDGHFWVKKNAAWTDFGSFRGEGGLNAFQMDVANGFVGTYEEWRATLRGQDGIGLRILGTFPSVDLLPMVANEPGDTYIIEQAMWVWAGESWEPVGQVGAAGRSAYQIARDMGVIPGTMTQYEWLQTLKGKTFYEEALATGAIEAGTTFAQFMELQRGPQGEQGVQGEQGPQGAPAAALVVKGKVVDQASLPTDASIGDAYFIGQNLWTWTGEWLDLGLVKGDKGDQGIQGEQGPAGPQGPSAYETAVLAGFTGTPEEWLATLKGDKGLDAYETSKAYGFLGTYEEWLESIRGPQGRVGPQGAPGQDLKIDGVVATSAELPATPAQSTAYIVANDLHIYLSGQWYNAGPIRGPQGPQGDQGVQGPQGEMGAAINIVGKLASVDELPASGTLGDGYLINGDLYGWNGSAFENFGKIQGPSGQDGQSAYQLAVSLGFVGGEAAWISSLKGAKGDKGDKGDTGVGLAIKGTLLNVSELPAVATDGDGYWIGTNLHMRIAGAWEDMGSFVGPKGDKGDKGDQGIQGPQGDGLKLGGFVSTAAELPATEEEGVSYLVGETIYLFKNGQWLEGPILRGPKGESAYGVAVGLGFTGTEAEWLASLQGPEGPVGPQGRGLVYKGTLTSSTELPENETVEDGDYFKIQGHFWVRSGGTWNDLGDLTGPQGPEGPMGPGIAVLGRLESTADLPTTGEMGKGYMIGLNFWVWDGTEYVDAGQIKGERGEVGPQGVPGPKGDTGTPGPKGEPGTRWLTLDRDPYATDGYVNDWALNKYTNQYFMKVSILKWAAIGFLGGGNVHDANWDGELYVRRNGQWMPLPVKEAPSDGLSYSRRNGQWEAFNRYDLKFAAATELLDLAQQQVFVIDVSINRTLSVANPPGAGRALTAVLVLRGTGGVITWPTSITWNGGTSPELGSTRTVVTLLFVDGEIIGNVATSV